MTSARERVEQSVAFLRDWDKGAAPPELALVLGSGLSDAIPELAAAPGLPFASIPGFKGVSVAGHAGDLRVLTLPGKKDKPGRRVAVLRGRNHAYEGHTPAEVVHNVRACAAWGVKGLILSNASGCLHPEWEMGRLMIIEDHINATGLTPLLGQDGVDFGTRFPDQSRVYCPVWEQAFINALIRQRQPVYRGVYWGTLGPTYETPAEIRMMQRLGASAVGMSTVLEATAARHMGLRIAAIACLTNHGAGLKQAKLEHADVVAAGLKLGEIFRKVVWETLAELPLDQASG